ncbi:MAG: hypothetical protein JO359_10680, partial [Candidatus Eremiobacteraeota bacterium]|nr:hypothetical protein [Candidatus Eremiobacteraeota bacterium]
MAQEARSGGTTEWPVDVTASQAQAAQSLATDRQTIVPSRAAADPSAEVAQAASPPMAHAIPYRHLIPLWRPGWEYTADMSIGAPFGATGKIKQYGLPGAGDVILKYGFSENSHLYIGYFGLNEYPIGFSTGVVPVYLQGVAVPIATQNLGTANPPGFTTPLNAVTVNRIMISHYDQAFWIGGMPHSLVPGGQLPIVISPTYTQRWGSIAGGSDIVPIEIDGLPYYGIHWRTSSFLGLYATIPVPILTQFKYNLFTQYTIGPQWLTGLNGANVSNHAQLVQILRTTWKPKEQITVELEPSLYPNILPTDKWPQHYLTMQYSIAYSFGKDTYDRFHRPTSHNLIPFIQAMVSMGGAMNLSPYGINALYCQQLSATGCSAAV